MATLYLAFLVRAATLHDYSIMRNIIDVAVSLMGIGLILLLAFLLNCILKKKDGHAQLRLPAACIFLLLIEILAFACDVSFKSGTANLIALAMIFPVYGILFVASRDIPQRWLRNTVGFLMFVPISFALLFSPVLLFVGLMLFDDISDPGHDTTALNQSYECRTFDAHGILATTYTVRVFRHWKLLPFIEHRVAEKWGDLDQSAQVGCDDVIAEYVGMHPGMTSELKIENTDADADATR